MDVLCSQNPMQFLDLQLQETFKKTVLDCLPSARTCKTNLLEIFGKKYF